MKNLIIKNIPGLQSYQTTFDAMKNFTLNRNEETLDEIWLLEHEPVFTQGQAGKAEHVLNPHQIPIIQTDRGGQVTYHGPGQLMVYALIDLKRKKLSVRDLVHNLEQTVVDLLVSYAIKSSAKKEAPGVYTNKGKICSIGLKVKRGCSYHGIAFNVAMDLTPFNFINPCGFKNLKMAQIKDFVPNITLDKIKEDIVPFFIKNFNYQ